ncbi:MAG: shikimate kinase [Candidatus Acidiferrales bacterium]
MPSSGEARNPKILCLIGFMGSGKSTVARLLARQIGWYAVDLDRRIVDRAGMTIPEIFKRHGEASFRDLEFEELGRVLGESIEQGKRMILSLGGGTTAQPRSLERLRENNCTLIWLHCPVEELLRRCARITDRPLFRDAASFRKLYEERQPSYELADYRIESAVEPLRVVEQILNLGIHERVPA